MKNYKEEFYKLLNLVKARDPFAFSRFSDGEVTVLRNKQVVIAGDHFIQHDIHRKKKVYEYKCENIPEFSNSLCSVLTSNELLQDGGSVGKFIHKSRREKVLVDI